MNCTTAYLSYNKTGFFSKIVTDYLYGADSLKPFYAYKPSIVGMQEALIGRNKITTNRPLLVNAINNQYQGIAISTKVRSNIDLLLKDNVFTITTAHQPNIFTGPLYFIYKIMHAIKLAEELAVQFSEYQFVPVYYMGSEDADLDEIGTIHVGGQKLVWNTDQTGAVGRMKVDQSFLHLIHTIEGQVGVLPVGQELIALFKTCYTEGKLIQQATLELVNQLFADFGIVVVIPDQAELKSTFASVIEKELTEQFSQAIVEKTASSLSLNYKVQATGRNINLFYLINNKRERIELNNEGQFEIVALKLVFTKAEILKELSTYPERFSPNVILRGVYQETILPNIAFIGGGGELAYWLELKDVFKAVNMPYPVLVLRNSFLFIEKLQKEKCTKLSLGEEDLFLDALDLINRTVNENSTNQLSLSKEIAALDNIYFDLKKLAASIDPSLNDHVLSLKNKAIKKVAQLEKKMFRAEKENFKISIQQITQLKESLFPNNSLQERYDNFSILYSTYGKQWLHAVHQASSGLNQQFGIIYVN